MAASLGHQHGPPPPEHGGHVFAMPEDPTTARPTPATPPMEGPDVPSAISQDDRGIDDDVDDEDEDDGEDDDDITAKPSTPGTPSTPSTTITELTAPAAPPKNKSKSKQERAARKGMKAGAQYRFKEEPFDFLLSLVPDYNAIDKRKGVRGKNKRLKDFWFRTQSEFWARFTWVQFVDMCAIGVEQDVVEEVNEAIKRFFRYQSSHAVTSATNPWAGLLAELRTGPSAPRRKTAWVRWGVDNKERVREVAGEDASICEHNRRARELFMAETKEVQDRYHGLVESEYEEATKNQMAALQMLAPTTFEDKLVARERLSMVVAPLLELIGLHTGFSCVTLIGGAYDEAKRKYAIGTVHHGVTADVIPKNFSDHDEEGFRRNFVNQFARFVSATRVRDGPSLPSERGASVDVEIVSCTAPEDGLTAAPTASQPPPSSSTTPRTVANVPQRPVPPSQGRAGFPSWACDELVRRTKERFEGQRRKTEIRRLSRLTQSDRDRENQAARQWALRPLLDTSSTSAPTPNSSLPTASTLGDSAASPPSRDNHEYSGNAHPSQPTAPLPPDHSPTATPDIQAPPSSTTPAVSARPAAPGEAVQPPAWFTEHIGVFLVEPMDPADYPIWKESLDSWEELERSRGFEGPPAGLPTGSRPSDIALWIQNARKYRIHPKKPTAYISGWWKWWNGLNPRWRERQDGRPVIGGSGDWSSLIKTGKNGWLTVFASLLGFRSVADPADWKAALTDVHWAIQQVLGASRANMLKRSVESGSAEGTDHADDEAVRPKKRRRK